MRHLMETTRRVVLTVVKISQTSLRKICVETFDIDPLDR